MNYIVTKYPHGTFSWADFNSTSMSACKTFYQGLFGWTSTDMPTGEGRPDYTMFYLDGRDVAGGSPTFMPDMPSVWNNYINVTRVDDVVRKVESLGGKVAMPAMDVLDSGRMAVIQDPTGAFVSLWEAKKHIGARVVNQVGAMCWNELYTPDPVVSQKFYGSLLGWTFQTDTKDGYVTILNHNRANGGMFTLTKDQAGMPPCWMVYFTVANLDAALTKVKELGGSIDMDVKAISPGKIAVVGDPAGAHFILIEMSVTPEEWVE